MTKTDTTSAAYDFGFSSGQNEYEHHNTFYTLAKQVYSNEEYVEAVAGFKAGRATLTGRAKAEQKRVMGR